MERDENPKVTIDDVSRTVKKSKGRCCKQKKELGMESSQSIRLVAKPSE